jgi:Protein of unknown function (DUF2934)
MSSLTATEEHPEKIEPTLPVHATPPVIEPGEPVSRRMIAEAAYYRAEKRGFAHGMALDDWLEAEKEIDALTRAAV